MSLKQIAEGSICHLCMQDAYFGIEDVEYLLTNIRNPKDALDFKEKSNYTFKPGVEYKVIFVRMLFNNTSHIGTKKFQLTGLSGNGVPYNKIWAEIFLVNENIKTNIYFNTFLNL